MYGGCAAEVTDSKTKDGGHDEAATADGGGPYSGFVTVVQMPNGGNTYESSFSAAFGEPVSRIFCPTPATLGCSFQECDFSGDSGAMQSAGTITITGGKLASPVQLLPATGFGPGPGYGEVDQPTAVFAPGDIFSVSASGGTIKAFQGSSAPSPSDIRVITPAPLDAGGDVQVFVIDETNDLNVTWSGGLPGSQIEVQVATQSFAKNVACYFDAAAGAGTVPATLLSQLGPADGGVTTDFNVVPLSSQDIAAANANVTIIIVGTPAYVAAFKTP